MRRLALGIALLLAFIVGYSNYPVNYDYMQDNTVLVRIVDPQGEPVGHGSGVIYRGDIITAGHVTKPVEQNEGVTVEILFRDGTVKQGFVKDTDFQTTRKSISTDLGLIGIKDFDNRGVSIDCSTQPIGKSVFVSGHPTNLRWSVTEGKVISTTPRVYYQEGDWLQIDSVVWKGNSGGPVFDYWGNLIGIVSHGNVAGLGAPTGHNFSVSGSRICDFVETFPEYPEVMA